MQFEKILQDRTHGSSYLALKYLDFLKGREISFSEINRMNEKLCNEFPDMAIIKNITDKLENTSDLRNTIQNLINQISSSPIKIASVLKNIIKLKSRILTFSNSHTVIKVLNQLDHRYKYCMESQPGGEGKKMALEIGGMILTDQEAHSLLPTMDVILYGCDRYDSTFFVNKVGTFQLCREARRDGIDCYVLTSTLKEVDDIGYVNNKMFERIPRDYIKIIGDKD